MYAVTAKYHLPHDIHPHAKSTGGLSASDALQMFDDHFKSDNVVDVQIIDTDTGDVVDPNSLRSPSKKK